MIKKDGLEKSRDRATSIGFFRSIQGKLLIWFLLFSLVPLAAMGVLFYGEAQKALRQEAFSQISTAKLLRQDRISQLSKRWSTDLVEMSKSPAIIYAMGDLANGFRFLGPEKVRSLYLNKPELLDAEDGSGYSAVHQEQHATLPGHKNILGFRDILLVDNDANVVYSTNKGKLFGVNLLSDAFKRPTWGAITGNSKTPKRERSFSWTLA